MKYNILAYDILSAKICNTAICALWVLLRALEP